MSDITNIKHIRFIPPEECNHIIIDMDEVVADTLPPIVDHLNVLCNTSVCSTEITNYDFTNFFDITQDILHGVFVDNNIIENVVPLEDAIEALHRIRKLGYKIHIVTARGWHKDGVHITMDWLDTHGGIYDSVTVMDGRFQSKSEAYQKVSDRFAYIVDDGLHNIDDAVHSEIVDEVVIISAPWNTSVDTYTDKTVNSLSEFATFLERGVDLYGDQ